MKQKIDSFYSLETLNQWGLVYKEQQCITAHTFIPTDTINFNLLIDNKPFYVHKTIENWYQRKRIIFADWTVNGLRKVSSLELHVYDNLLRSGFNFYVLTTYGLVEVHTISVLQMYFDKLAVPTPRAIETILSGNNWVCDEVFVLTTDFIDAVEELSPAYVSVNQYFNKAELAYLNSLKRLHLKIEDTSFLQRTAYLQTLCAHAEGLHLYCDTIRLSQALPLFPKLRKLITTNYSENSDDTFNVPYLRDHLEEITLDSCTQETLENLASFTKLQKIAFHTYSNWVDDFLKLPCLPQIKALTLHYKYNTDFSFEELDCIFVNCPNLAYLNIAVLDYYPIKKDLPTKKEALVPLKNTLPNLTELILDGFVVPQSQLTSLLVRCTHLKKYKIKHTGYLKPTNFLTHLPNLSTIEQFKWDIDVKIRKEDKKYIYEQFKNLQIVSIKNNYYDDEGPHAIRLKAIPSLHAIIPLAHNSQIIESNAYKREVIIEDPNHDLSETLNYSWLETLEIKGNSINFSHLVTQCVNITTIRLHSVALISNPNEMPPMQDLVHLVNLHLESTTVSANQLSGLLTRSPHLVQLKIDNCKGLTDALTIKQPLNQLKILHLTQSEISENNVNLLTANAPNLEVIKLAGRSYFSSIDFNRSKIIKIISDDVKGNFPMQAKELFFENSVKGKSFYLSKFLSNNQAQEKINIRNAHIFFEADGTYKAPNLREITFVNCTMAYQALRLLVKNCPLLELIVLKNTNIKPEWVAYIKTTYPDLMVYHENDKLIIEPNKSIRIDTDTVQNPAKQMNATQYIKNMPVSEYRMHVLTFDTLSQSLIKVDSNNTLQPVTLDYLAIPGDFQGSDSITFIGEQCTYPLKGKSPYDVMQTLRICDSQHNELHKDQYAIFKCSKTGLYFLKFNACHDRVTVTYSFNSPDTRFIANTASAEEMYIGCAIQYFLSFGSGALQIKTGASAAEILDQIYQQKVGACRHRSMVFARLFSNYPCFVVTNEVHAFVEMFIKGKWQTIDLGGFAVNLAIKEVDIANTQTITKPVKKPIIPLQRVKQPFSDITTCLNLLKACQQPALVVVTPQEKQSWIYDVQTSAKDHVFCVKPEDIHLQSKRLSKGQTKAVDSELALFLKDVDCDKRYVLIDFTDCKPTYIALYTALADEGKIGQTKLPDSVQAVIVLPSTLYPNMASDFRSRFTKTTFYAQDYQSSPQNVSNAMEIESLALFDLYFEESFEALLVGTYKMDANGKLEVVSGALIKALRDGALGLSINHAPNTKAFKQWFNTLQTQRKVYFNGKNVHLPEDFVLVLRNTDFDLRPFTYMITNDENGLASYDVNACNLPLFFSNCICDEKGHYIENKGIIEKANAPIRLQLTEKLPLQSLAKLLNEAQHHKITLQFSGPRAYVQALINETHALPVHFTDSFKTNANLVTTNDIAFYVTQHSIENQVLLPINKNTRYEELVGTIQIMRNDNASFQCQLQKGPLVNALLENNQSVILFGEISMELAIRLASAWFDSNPYLWLNGQQVPIKGRLQVVTQAFQTPCLPFVTPHCDYSVDDFYAVLEQTYTLATPLLNTIKRLVGELDKKGVYFSYERLKLVFKNAYAHNPFKSVLLLEPNAQTLIEFIKSHLVTNKIPSIPIETNKRLNKLTQAYAQHPDVFMVGQTGVGKSYFVEKELPKHFQVFVFNAQDPQETLLQWFTTISTQPKVLVLDEINLMNKAFITQLSTLHKGALIGGKFYTRTKNELTLYIGNPPSYRGRTQCQFFNEMPAIHFKPLKSEALFDLLVKPLFKRVLYWAPVFWQENKKLLTAPEKTPRDIVEASLRFIASGDSFFTKEPMNDSTLCITSNWKKILQDMQSDLTTRQYKLDNKLTLGKQGLIVEGDSSLAKSAFIRALLQHNDIEYVDLTGKNLQTIEEGLLHAFHKGNVVLIDELNTVAPLFERLLNHLLSGTDCDKKPAKRLGFFLIGTQNPPSTFPGRIPLSEALENRMIKYCVEPYTKKHIVTILQNKGFRIEQASELAKRFIAGKQLDPTLSLRDVVYHPKEAIDLKRTMDEEAQDSSLSLKQLKSTG